MLALTAVAATGAGVAVGAGGGNNDVGPKSRIQPSGRLLAPPGKLTTLGNHPGGGALTRNGRFLWTLSAGRGRNDIRIVEVVPPGHRPSGDHGRVLLQAAREARTGRLVQTIPMPGLDGGITMARDNRTAYVSGTPESEHQDQQSPAGTPGKQGDVIHVFHYDGTTGVAKRAEHAPRAAAPGTAAPQVLPGQGQFQVGPPIPQNFLPTNTAPQSWPRDLALSLQTAGRCSRPSTSPTAPRSSTPKTKAVRYVEGRELSLRRRDRARNGRGPVSNEADGTVSVLDPGAGTGLKDIAVGAHLSHPEGIAADSRADRA